MDPFNNRGMSTSSAKDDSIRTAPSRTSSPENTRMSLFSLLRNASLHEERSSAGRYTFSSDISGSNGGSLSRCQEEVATALSGVSSPYRGMSTVDILDQALSLSVAPRPAAAPAMPNRQRQRPRRENSKEEESAQ
ncbi:expressed unknown protein [Seminavis robusta]|uniref:Uncharacterized protein n=1 Tax=Seminavis robusta TaxID=568900 RepID=A0A9N8EYI6_9STRA|nr:expressed unknown protein [Seminavis robusta]|eukprot:Sro2293_g322260.1 n/a (135) ;mRNA; r:5405-5809